MKRFIYLIIICTLLVGCKGNQQKTALAESDGKPMVTVTIPPYQYFVDKIAHDKVDVNVMVCRRQSRDLRTHCPADGGTL